MRGQQKVHAAIVQEVAAGSASGGNGGLTAAQSCINA